MCIGHAGGGCAISGRRGVWFVRFLDRLRKCCFEESFGRSVGDGIGEQCAPVRRGVVGGGMAEHRPGCVASGMCRVRLLRDGVRADLGRVRQFKVTMGDRESVTQSWSDRVQGVGS